MTHPPNQERPEADSTRVEALERRVVRLQGTLRDMEDQRSQMGRQRRRQLLIVGVGISLLVHLGLMYYLASQYRLSPSSRGPEPVSFEFAILQEEQLTELETAELDDLIPEVVSDQEDLAEEVAALDPVVPSAELDVTNAGALPALGGSGSGTGDGGALSGGGAGTSFFGVSSRGMRFAFIVDRSGSMRGQKMPIAKRELARSIESLPDYAYFHVVMFSTDFVEPQWQKGWTRARRSSVNRLIRWLNDLDPTGGTEPIPAFDQVFALDVRPDVIFFLTDGEIPEFTADLVADMNRGGGRVVINTIAFGDAQSQDLLQRMARESGGTYRFVTTEGY